MPAPDDESDLKGCPAREVRAAPDEAEAVDEFRRRSDDVLLLLLLRGSTSELT